MKGIKRLYSKTDWDKHNIKEISSKITMTFRKRLKPTVKYV